MDFLEGTRLEFDRADADVKQTEVPRTSSATGYGPKQPTSYMVLQGKRWHRVYCAIFSNNGTLYIVKDNRKVIIDIY